MEWKWCESIGCWIHHVALTFDITHDLGLGFLRSNFQIAISQELEGRLTWNERDVSRIWYWTHFATLNFELKHDMTLNLWNFMVKLWKSCISGMDVPIDMKQNGYEWCDLTLDLDLGFSRLNFEHLFIYLRNYFRYYFSAWQTFVNYIRRW